MQRQCPLGYYEPHLVIPEVVVVLATAWFIWIQNMHIFISVKTWPSPRWKESNKIKPLQSRWQVSLVPPLALWGVLISTKSGAQCRQALNNYGSYVPVSSKEKHMLGSCLFPILDIIITTLFSSEKLSMLLSFSHFQFTLEPDPVWHSYSQLDLNGSF